MKRKYNTKLIKGNRSYSIEELAKLYNIHPATVRDWIKLGLPTIDKNRPYLMHGPAIRDWLDNKQKARRWKREYGELPCFTCKKPRKIKSGTFKILPTNTLKIKIQGECIICNRTIGRGDVKANEDRLTEEYNPSPKTN